MLQYNKLISSEIDFISESLVSTVWVLEVLGDKSKYSQPSLHKSRYSLLVILTGISYPSLLIGWDNFCCESIHVIRSIEYVSDGSDTLCS